MIYSRLGEKADSVIKKIISKEKKEWIVVSSDRDIMAYAWSCDSVPVPSDTFQPFLEQTSGSFKGEYDFLDDDSIYEKRKGNPRQLSKKEKALARVLKKL